MAVKGQFHYPKYLPPRKNSRYPQDKIIDGPQRVCGYLAKSYVSASTGVRISVNLPVVW
jgi:hypothetical protein